MTTRPANVHFYFYPYATFSEQVVLKDSDGDPIDLTGYTGRLQIKRDDGTVLFTLTTDPDGGIVLGGAAGTVTFTIDAEDTGVDLVDPDGDQWVYDLLMTNTNAAPDTVDRTMQGTIFALPGVTTPP